MQLSPPMRGSFTLSTSMALLQLYSWPSAGHARPHAAVVVDVVAALAVGEDLDALDKAGGVGRGQTSAANVPTIGL